MSPMRYKWSIGPPAKTLQEKPPLTLYENSSPQVSYKIVTKFPFGNNGVTNSGK